MSSTLAERIRQARIEAKLTQREVGAACRPPISPQAIFKWERGESAPSAANLFTLAQMTNRTMQWFLYGDHVANTASSDSVPGTINAGRDVPSVEFSRIVGLLRGDASTQQGTVRTHFPCSPMAFQTHIMDDANAPLLVEGDSVIIDPGSPLRPGKLCLAVIDGNPIIRRYIERGERALLEPLNKAWSEREVALSDVVGPITEISRRLY